MRATVIAVGEPSAAAASLTVDFLIVDLVQPVIPRTFSRTIDGDPPTPSAVERARSAGPSPNPASLQPQGHSLQA